MPTNTTKHHALSKWALIFAGWTFLALLFSGPQMIQAIRLNRVAEGWSVVAGELIFSYLWLAFTPFAIWLSKSFRIEGGQRFKSLTVHFLASVVFLLTHILLFTVISIPFGWYSQLTPFSNRYLLLILNFTPSNVMFYWGIIVIEHAIDYYRKLQDRELKASQLEAQLAQSQLQVLKMQLHPHFLFNTLNAISALIRESPDEAEEMVSRLGDLLRMTLETAGLQEVSFKKELEFLHHRIHLLRVIIYSWKRSVCSGKTMGVNLPIHVARVMRIQERHVTIHTSLRLWRVVEGPRAEPRDAAGLPIVVVVESANPAVIVDVRVEVYLVTRRAEIRSLAADEWFQKSSAMRFRVHIDQEVMQRLYSFVRARRKLCQLR